MAPPDLKRRAPVPDHIDKDRLPQYVYWQRKGKGRWIYKRRCGKKFLPADFRRKK